MISVGRLCFSRRTESQEGRYPERAQFKYEGLEVCTRPSVAAASGIKICLRQRLFPTLRFSDTSTCSPLPPS